MNQPLRSSHESQDDPTAALLTPDNGRSASADIEANTPVASRVCRSRVVRLCAAALLIAAFVGGIIAISTAHPGAGTHSTLVTARNGAVAADEPRCSAIGADVLREGGNAVDAAVASTLCIGVLQAHSSGIGGGGFMLVRPAHGARPLLIDFRETAGQAATSDMFINNITDASIGPLAS
ncbi:hypothetical protein IWW50_006627, partial [Coemansia erecta]